MGDSGTRRVRRTQSGRGAGIVLLVLGALFLLQQATGMNLFAAFGEFIGSVGAWLLPALLILLGALLLLRGPRQAD